jgi:hypothetical protein
MLIAHFFPVAECSGSCAPVAKISLTLGRRR